MKAPIFNDYDENGYRVNHIGCKTSMTEDNNLRDNLRFRFGKEIEHISDAKLIQIYDEFCFDELYGDNDENFLVFLRQIGESKNDQANRV